MKTKQLILFFFILFGLSTLKLYAGVPYIIEYSPSNPVAGQPVTFTLITNDGCADESLVPDVVGNIAGLIVFPGGMPNSVMYTYPTEGMYHVGLDLEFFGCLRDKIKETNRDLTTLFQMGPVDGPKIDAVIQVQGQDQIYCSPITIAAAPAPIPTMGQWSIIILSILTSIVGVVFAMNRITAKAQV